MAYAVNANILNTAILARAAPEYHLVTDWPASMAWFVVTLGTASTAYVVGGLVPFLSELLAFVGASAGIATTYLFPCIFALKILPMGIMERAFLVLVTCAAFAMAVVGVIVSLNSIVLEAGEKPAFSCH